MPTGTSRQTARLFPNHPTVLIHQAHWTRFLGDLPGCGRAFERLARVAPGRAQDLAALWNRIDNALATPLFSDLPGPEWWTARSVIVILGFLLRPDGSIDEPLRERLETGLAVWQRHPDAAIVVSGGVPRSGRVEASVMAEWLAGAGVPRDVIREEGYSRDLVENVIYTTDILALTLAESVLVVTSAIDIRRAVVCFETIRSLSGQSYRVAGTAAKEETVFLDNGDDALKLYRDSLRALGLPIMAIHPELTVR